METKMLIAFIAYFLAAMGSIGFGVIYLTRSQSMPYHQEALGMRWDQHDPRLQALLLGLLRTVGGALVGAGVSELFLLIFPFRSGETWVYYAIPVAGLITSIPALYATIFIRRRTGAHTPFVPGLIAVGLVLVGVIFTII